MKTLVSRVASILVLGMLATGTAARALSVPDSAAYKGSAAIANLKVGRRTIGFNSVKKVTIESVGIRNTGTIDADVTVVAPSPPFSVTVGGGSFTLAPGAVQTISVQFAPTAAGWAKDHLAIQCANCVTPADDNVAVALRGHAKAATPVTAPNGANALPFLVTAGPFDGTDQPLASVTICATGTSHCTTVNNVLIDTGSFGLRIFGSQITGLGITPSEIGECAFFGSGSTWGSVATVDVKLAGEPTTTMPIQVIDDTESFALAPRECTQGTQLLSSPTVANFNGLLGVGQVSDDVGFSEYFNCPGEECSLAPNPPTEDIVVNPVSTLPVDNNGVVVRLPSISPGGAVTTAGTLYFGIGTESDNHPGKVNTYVQNSSVNSNDFLDINTIFNGIKAGGFFDTGSNGYFFDSSIKGCVDGSGFYCPAKTLSERATNKGVAGSTSGVVSFAVANATRLFDSQDAAFDDLGGSSDGGTRYNGFDWGLPFFFGRTVYMGIAGTSSSLGAGPYIAY